MTRALAVFHTAGDTQSFDPPRPHGPYGGNSPLSATYNRSRISVLSAIWHALPMVGDRLGCVLTAPSK
jgi:hypothetical protein